MRRKGLFLYSDNLRINGAAAEPLYLPQKFTGPEPTANIKGAKLYTGGCHCGAVTIAFKAKPFPIKGEQVFEEVEYIQECNCRTCVRVCFIGISRVEHLELRCRPLSFTHFYISSTDFDCVLDRHDTHLSPSITSIHLRPIRQSNYVYVWPRGPEMYVLQNM